MKKLAVITLSLVALACDATEIVYVGHDEESAVTAAGSPDRTAEAPAAQAGGVPTLHISLPTSEVPKGEAMAGGAASIASSPASLPPEGAGGTQSALSQASGGASTAALLGLGGSLTISTSQPSSLPMDQARPVKLVILLDTSGSMGDDPATKPNWANKTTRWDPMVAGLTAFFEQAPKGASAALTYFPVSGDAKAICQHDYSAPNVPMTDMSSPKPLIDSLAQQQTRGSTPTYPALLGALRQHAALVQLHENPEARVVVVLITDGEPYPDAYPNDPSDPTGEVTACAPEGDISRNTVETIANRLLYSEVPVFVVGIGDANQKSIELMAKSAGTKPVFITSSVTPDAVVEALKDAIR